MKKVFLVGRYKQVSTQTDFPLIVETSFTDVASPMYGKSRSEHKDNTYDHQN